ncbi:DUF1003 domain-containing protein [Roseimicrobium sp. ORNL1]|uniref:DUF1003 domain-containing protein n=1 Tax=Roseimicrobium sp. ORNL1 TaxID=2711231 RepID=UPI0013E1B689|nr:DUF1003 domain-containing protein [Roseimicrobium sp. ORNL1]QIF04375.1 DUF1003 domain-containing protein [Roseimicrobium sp. ORNL1]
MSTHSQKTGVCAITGKTVPLHQLVPLGAVRPQIGQELLSRHPDLSPASLVSTSVINDARLDHVRALLASQLGELTHLDESVLKSLHQHELLSQRPADVDAASTTFGQRMADGIATFGGSWAFILTFGGFLLLWIAVNVLVLAARPFDPYPFILLNLILSCIAAFQAPVIMMSQNRQEARDRLRAENDYKVNLKAELEIRHLHEKMDFLLHQHSAKLLEIQQIQLDLMREAAGRRENRGEKGT